MLLYMKNYYSNKNKKTRMTGIYYHDIQYKKQKYYFKIICGPILETCTIIWQKEPWLGDLD